MNRFFVLLLLVFTGFFSCRGEARLDPESHALLSDPGYAKHIEVKCYLVTREELAKVFASKNEPVVQRTNKELYHQNLFLLVRCRNKGEYAAFGTLECLPPNCGSSISIDLARMWANEENFDDYVIYLGPVIIFSNDELPQIKYEWDCLYKI